jgi:hypothetical protein
MRGAHFFTATPFVLGTGPLPKQRVRIEKISVEPGSILVLFGDGLKSSTSLDGHIDVLRQPAIAIARRLLEDNSGLDDDAMVLVARFPT